MNDMINMSVCNACSECSFLCERLTRGRSCTAKTFCDALWCAQGTIQSGDAAKHRGLGGLVRGPSGERAVQTDAGQPQLYWPPFACLPGIT